MANALVGRKNLLDITYYPVILTRGSWEPSLPLANLKDPLLVNAAQSTNAAKASTQWEVDFSVPRDERLLELSLSARRELRSNWTLGVEYQWFDNDSTADEFAYDGQRDALGLSRSIYAI